jgi:hypothetical protein
MEREGAVSVLKSAEQRLLAQAAALNPGPGGLEKIRRLMSGNVDANHLVRTAYKEGLAGFLYRNLERSDSLDRLGGEQKQTLQFHYYSTAGFNLKLIHDFKQFLHRLNRKKIRVVLLQGIGLVNEVYKDIGLRPMMDIDLWVRPHELPEVMGTLTDLGYEQDSVYTMTLKRGTTAFDLHTHLLWADRIRARKLLLKMGEESVYEAARVADFQGEEALCLSPEDQVMYLSLHAFKHYVTRLIWLVDIQCLVSDWEQSNWQALLLRAKTMGQEKTLFSIFFLLQSLLDFQLPAEAQPFFKGHRRGFMESNVLKTRLKRGRVPVWAPIVLTSAGQGMGSRFSLLRETLFPRPEILRQIFPSQRGLNNRQLRWRRFLQLLGMIKTSNRKG